MDTWSLRYVARYVLNTNTAKFWQYEDEWYTLEELYENYDYLILLSRDEEIEAFLAENGLNPSAECIHLTRCAVQTAQPHRRRAGSSAR